MSVMVLPGVYVQVNAEGLIVPGRITVSNLGVVGTASMGQPFVPRIVASIAEARQAFGNYDAWAGDGSDLTLVRALELAFQHGAPPYTPCA